MTWESCGLQDIQGEVWGEAIWNPSGPNLPFHCASTQLKLSLNKAYLITLCHRFVGSCQCINVLVLVLGVLLVCYFILFRWACKLGAPRPRKWTPPNCASRDSSAMYFALGWPKTLSGASVDVGPILRLRRHPLKHLVFALTPEALLVWHSRVGVCVCTVSADIFVV